MKIIPLYDGDEFDLGDRKRFNMSYLPDNIFGEANPKHIIR